MKKILLPFLLLTILTACEKEQTASPDAELEARTNNVAICHYDSENDTWHVISVNENAWAAHASHGDVRLDDQDDDGYVPDNECGYGQQGDCDDNNAAINPGAAEICDNDLDDDCDGDVDEADSDCETGCVPGELEVTLPGGITLYVYPTDNGTGIPWGELNNDIDALPNLDLGSVGNDFDGAGNTAKIVAKLQGWNGGNYAAKKCADLAAATGCDWYLPAAGEFKAVLEQLEPNQISGNYWTSSEHHPYYGYNMHTATPNVFGQSWKTWTLKCRCVRR